jgi:hypothetical protein
MTRIRLAALVATFACGIAILSSANADPAEAKANYDRIVQAAKETLVSMEGGDTTDWAEPEDIYRWSRRLMLAEVKANSNPNAKLDHVARIGELYDRIVARHKVGGATRREFLAATYYLEKAKSE